MKTFSKEVREAMYRSSGGRCQMPLCTKQVTEFHHLLSNTKVNQKLYPMFLQSPFNCLPICNDCHMTKPKQRISENLVIVFEQYLNVILK